jgi:hypothetical protein
LARPFGGKQLKRVHKTLENERRSFDPVDSSLLLQDHTGFNLTKKLHSRVHSIEKEQRNYLLSPQPSKRDDFKPKRVLHESIKRCMLKPMFIESVLTSTKKVLASQPQLKDAKINWSNLNIDHIIESMNKKTKPKNSKNDHCVELYEISKLPAEIRDKHCQKDRPTEVHFFVNSKKTTNSSTLMKASPSLSPDKNNQNRLNGKKDQPFDVTRLPYLYLCPSI